MEPGKEVQKSDGSLSSCHHHRTQYQNPQECPFNMCVRMSPFSLRKGVIEYLPQFGDLSGSVPAVVQNTIGGQFLLVSLTHDLTKFPLPLRPH